MPSNRRWFWITRWGLLPAMPRALLAKYRWSLSNLCDNTIKWRTWDRVDRNGLWGVFPPIERAWRARCLRKRRKKKGKKEKEERNEGQVKEGAKPTRSRRGSSSWSARRARCGKGFQASLPRPAPKGRIGHVSGGGGRIGIQCTHSGTSDKRHN